MPRYHFNIHDSLNLLDEEGIDLPDAHTARTEAIRLAGGMLLDKASLIHDQKGWHMRVTDSSGNLVLRVDLSITDPTTMQ